MSFTMSMTSYDILRHCVCCSSTEGTASSGLQIRNAGFAELSRHRMGMFQIGSAARLESSRNIGKQWKTCSRLAV